MLLGIETSTTQGSIALAGSGLIQEQRMLPEGLDLEAHLVPHISALCCDHNITPKDLTAVAISIGPGSYTGLRIGITCAKTLSMSLAIPLVAVSSLMALAMQVCGKVLAVRDARRGQVYAGLYQILQDADNFILPEILIQDHLTSPEALEEILQPNIQIVGDVDCLKQTSQTGCVIVGKENPHAAHVAKIGQALLDQGRIVSPLHALAPNYLQEPLLRVPGEKHAAI